MNSTTINDDATLSTKLRTILVSEIKLGMVVHAIAKQTGSLGVKNKGRVKNLSIIEQLSAHGVVSVIVEPPPLPDLQIDETRKKNLPFDQPKQSKNPLKTNKNALNTKHNDVKFELGEATKLLARSKTIHKQYVALIQKEIKVDFIEAQEVVSNVYESLTNNPEALLCLSMIMHSSDYLANHAIHVATLMCHFGQYLGMSKAECERIALVGYLFDIGMVKVPLSIREKKGALEPKEQVEIQKHVTYSLQILAGLALDRECLLAIEQHHERLDGSGYPNGYSGSKIHKYSRMLAIVDCYDALTTKRQHQTSLSPAGAMKVLSNPDYGYDQKLVLKFIKCLGIYPVGSLVVLSNKHIALVTKTNRLAPTQPEVKIFYSIAESHFVPQLTIDLAKPNDEHLKYKGLRVIKPVLAAQYGLDVAQIL